RAAAYREARGLATAASLPVLVQELVQADISAVAFSANPVTGALDEIVINASFGLGEAIAGGLVNPDHVVVARETLEVASYVVGDKAVMTIATAESTREV